ncbi:hypothetical protein GCM10007100_02160 [Roseibacillus persicicus]|uniref:Uncharacterized protein n=1 Tax=Roseibacillus persicicus TaxID=454148 RepID=A0A918TBV7_9BACT|nr:hypothetical protein GCM10007100_02160 [Roseibacillus persicicus]
MKHRGAEDVPGGEKANLVSGYFEDFVVSEGLNPVGPHPKTLSQEMARGGRTENFLMAGKVVRVSMGDESMGEAAMGIQVEVQRRQVQGWAGAYVDEGIFLH